MNKKELKALEKKQTAHMQHEHSDHKDGTTGPVSECMRKEFEDGKPTGNCVGTAKTNDKSLKLNKEKSSHKHSHKK